MIINYDEMLDELKKYLSVKFNIYFADGINLLKLSEFCNDTEKMIISCFKYKSHIVVNHFLSTMEPSFFMDLLTPLIQKRFYYQEIEQNEQKKDNNSM